MLRFEREMLDYLRHNGSALQNIRETKTFDDDTAAGLREQIAEFKKGFTTGEGRLLAGREEHEALGEEEFEQEKIVKQRRADPAASESRATIGGTMSEARPGSEASCVLRGCEERR